MLSQTENQFVLDVLAEAQKLIFLEKNWSKFCAATKSGHQSAPWDLHADAWSIFGAIEKVLLDKKRYNFLLTIASKVEVFTDEPLLKYDLTHSHKEVMELFYRAMQPIAEELNLNMYSPLFASNEDLGEDEYPVFFILKDLDKALDEEDDRLEVIREERRRQDHLDLQYSRDD